MYLGPGIMYSINLVALSILIITQMVKISPYLTVFVLIPLPVMSFLIYKVSSKMNLMSKNVQVEQSMLSTLAQETFAGIRVVKAYSREKEAHEKFNATAEQYKTKSMKMVIFNAFFMPTIVFLIGLSTLLTIYIGGKLTYNHSISIGGIVAFIFFVNKLTWPFASIGWVTSINQRAAASQTRINEFLMTEPMIKNTSNDSFDFDGNIEFKNVSFTYENSGITALKNISFTLKKGETLGIIGRTGSGKTTILNLLMRQLDVDSGELCIDGKNIKSINLDQFRGQTGIVPQDVFLFSDTIANNVKFGSNDPAIGLDRVIECTKKAHVYDNIIAFPDQFETLLGERGVNLSGGQKQRISIARALIRDPKLLLLDDCLSAVDTETEEIILNHLKEEFKQRTSIIVSHRISSIRHANKLIVIDDGTIIESGTHETLLALNGVYAEMYTKQLADENDLNQTL